ncbi:MULTISPECIES: DUF881 domain-containing protein [unclassified Nocardioides]|uniref:DUF881 domain-containing protein n=1 Tax=unclassified Nocardioides TaxID=2615069 RepID=UPI0009F11E8F|nr:MULTISPECIES: DUF881 domain-containing protein [unclassified Nocardioides]GAW48451.1 uncharacterized protein PD653B2_0765 [Nocardioides sp. PD653-B2]GAW53376.1 uncharacterized protein PD653_0775 [Nocardioides sp. PD653]
MPDDLEDDHGGAEATPERQPSGRDRLRRAFLRPSRGQLVVAVLLALVGFASITQVRFNEVDNTYGSLREQDLIDVLNGLAGTTQRAEAEIARLQHTRDDLQSSTGAREAALAQAQDEAETLAILAGLVPVTGPGIRVTITEGDTAVDINTVVDMIQELRTAGAEAIQINGEVRVVASTSFADGVGGILVGDQLVSSPYVVDVIGEPHLLAESGIDFPKGPRDQFEEGGATVEVDELPSLDIESVVEPERPEYALPNTSQ